MSHNPILAYSWEFITTLEYEWDVIRGRLSCQWTIWVRNNMLELWLPVPEPICPQADMLVQYSIGLLACPSDRPFGHNPSFDYIE